MKKTASRQAAPKHIGYDITKRRFLMAFLTIKETNKYQSTIRRLQAWAYANLPRIMKEKDIQAHYKAPYFWVSVGDARMAGFYRNEITRRFLRADGDFRTTGNRKGFFVFDCTVHNQYIYPNGWITTAMQRMGAYDVVRPALDFILRFQDPKYGGFYYAFDPRTKKINKKLMDSSSTSAAGIACLACGRTAEAEAAGDFILRLFRMQPRPDKYFFSCVNGEGRVHTDVFRTENQWDPDSRKQKCLAVGSDGLNELTWLIGKPTKFLARLYTATGKKKYLDGAVWAFDFFHRLEKRAWINYASCKTMWAGAELYRLTGQKRFAQTAVKFLDYFATTQRKSGSWVHTLWYKDEASQAFTWTCDIAWEFGGEISDVISDLSARG
jgi:hypothetical protein